MHWMRSWASSRGSWARYSSPSHSSRSPCRRADGCTLLTPSQASAIRADGQRPLRPLVGSFGAHHAYAGSATNKFVDDEGFERFYTVPTATTSRDRLLLALKRGYPEHFAAVFELKSSPREAGIRAGIIKTRRFRCGGVCDSPESLPSGPAHEPQSQSGHENGYNDTTPPEPSLSGGSDYEVQTLRRGRRSFETAQTAAVS